MSSVTIGFLVGGLTLVLLAVRIHIGMAMLVGGSIGYIAVSSAMLGKTTTGRLEKPRPAHSW